MKKSNWNLKIIFAAVCIFAVLAVIILAVKTKMNENTGTTVTESVTTEQTTELKTNPNETEEDTSKEVTENTTEKNSETAKTPDSETPVKKTPVKSGKVYQEKFDALRAKYNNDDIIGIIKVPDSSIYYPIAYSPDNNEYYLNRNLYKNRSAAGSIFMDYENSVERYDPNTVLYGHQMSSNSMFHSLGYYMNEEYFNNHRYIIFNTIYGDNVWEVFAYFKTDTSFNYIKVFFKTEKDFLDLAAEMKRRSVYDTGIEIEEGDRILTLSTCTNQEVNTRYVLSARMIKNREDIPEEIAAHMNSAVEDFK